MNLFKRSPWLLMVLLFLISALAISSTRSTEEAKVSNEKSVDEELFADGEGDEYDGLDGSVGEFEGDSPYQGPESGYPPPPAQSPPSGQQYGPLPPFTYAQPQPTPQSSGYSGSYQLPPVPAQEQYGENYATQSYGQTQPPSYSSPPPPPPAVEYLPPPPPPPQPVEYVAPISYSAPLPLPPPQVEYPAPQPPPPPPQPSYYSEPLTQGYVMQVPVPIPALTHSIPLEVQAPIAVEPRYQPVPLPQPVQLNYTSPPTQSYQAPVQQTYQAPAQQSYQVPTPVQPQQAYQALALVQPQQAYQAPAQPQQTYQAPAPAPVQPQQSYQAPAPAPVQQQPQQTYQAPAQPQQSYQAPAPVQQQPQQTYQAPAQPQQTYQAPTPTPAPVQPQQSYQAPAQVQQQPQPQQTYQAPAQPQQSYQAPAQPQAPVYLPPVTITYQPPASPVTKTNYQPPKQQQQQPQQQSYAPKPQPIVAKPPQPAYRPPSSTNYTSAPVPPQPKLVNNYAPVYQPNLQYTPVVLVRTNYTQTITTVSSYKPPVSSPAYVPKPPQQSYRYAPAGVQQYSHLDVSPITSPFNYRGNNPWLTYYRQLRIRNCPKGPLIGIYGLSSRDISAAVAYAQNQLGQFRNTNTNYMNASQPSFAARHQIFSLLSQQNARMDEEGLLIELVSQYLADRVCLTKWDRQRYLPQLTKLISTNQFPGTHSCSNYYQQQQWQQAALSRCHSSKYRTIDGFCNNPYHPYWGKSNVCHIRLLSPDYADGISLPRDSSSSIVPIGRLPNPRSVSSFMHSDIPIDGPYNMMKMQWGQFINHDITNTALSSYDGLIDCCKSPQTRGCWPILVPPGDRFYGPLNVTCLNFIRSGVCPTCQLGPRQQYNKNTAFLDLSHVYGNTNEQAIQLRSFRNGQLRVSTNRIGEVVLPLTTVPDQCVGTCYLAGDSRVNQHPALTALHTLLMRNHNKHAVQLEMRHRNWNDEQLFQEARRLNIAEYQMITYNEYFPIVFGPILSAYYKLNPSRQGYTQYDPKTDPTTWNEYSTATCRFGHSQIASSFGLYTRIFAQGQKPTGKEQSSFPLKEWFMRPSLLAEGLLNPIMNGLLGAPSQAVDPWVSDSVRNHLYQAAAAKFGGDLAATNIWRGRDHGLPGYTQYVEYCFNVRVSQWRDLAMFIPNSSLQQLRKVYRHPDQVDLFTGGMVERHFPGADIGPTFACVNGIQYFHLKFGDRYYFEHGGQAGSFSPVQLDEIRRSTLARLVCRTSQLGNVPQFAFLQPSIFNPLVNCSQVGDIDYNKF